MHPVMPPPDNEAPRLRVAANARPIPWSECIYALRFSP